MKKTIHSFKSSVRLSGVIIGAAALASVNASFIGCHVPTANIGSIDNSEGDSMLPTVLWGFGGCLHLR
jgi:hypothetical protein